MLRKIAALASLFSLIVLAFSAYAAGSMKEQQQKLAASVSQLPIIYIFDGKPPQPADCTVGNLGEYLSKLGFGVSMRQLDANTFVMDVSYNNGTVKKEGVDHFVFLLPQDKKNKIAILARYLTDDTEVVGDQKNRVLWPILSNVYREKSNLSHDYVLSFNTKKDSMPDAVADANSGSAKADEFFENQDDNSATFDPDNPCGNVAANFPVRGDLRFVLLATPKGYFPYYYSKKENPDCGEEAGYVCAKVLKKQEVGDGWENDGVKAWEITIIHQCKAVAAPG